jgi:hypothetical protein
MNFSEYVKEYQTFSKEQLDIKLRSIPFLRRNLKEIAAIVYLQSIIEEAAEQLVRARIEKK